MSVSRTMAIRAACLRKELEQSLDTVRAMAKELSAEMLVLR